MTKKNPPVPVTKSVVPEPEDLPVRGPFLAMVKTSQGYQVVSIKTQGREIVDEEVLTDGPVSKMVAVDEIRKAVVLHFFDL